MKTKISIFLLLILLFSSCENGINHSDSKQNNSSSHTSEKSLVVVSGRLKIDKNTVHEKSTARNAIPSVPYVYSTDDDYEYFVQAISSNGLTHEVIADPENWNYYEISLEWGERWSISAGMRKKADNSIIMLDADSASGKALSFLFDNDNLYYSFNFILQPLQKAGKGRVELSMEPVPVDSVTGEAYVTELKLYITKDGSLQEWFPDLIQVSIDSSNEDNNYIKSIGTDYNIPSGSYDVTFIYYKTYTSQSPAIKLPVYITHQVINVYDNLETTEWNNFSSNYEYDIITSSGIFRLTEELIKQFANTTFYAGNTGVGEAPSDTSGSGSPYAPLKTLKKATEIIKTINDGSSVYRIFICEDQDLSDLTESLSLVPDDKAMHLTIQSYPIDETIKFNLDGSETSFGGALIKIAGKSNLDTIVTLRNLSIFGHTNNLTSASNGGGILCSKAKVLLENCDIRQNECGNYGGGVFATTNSIVTIKDSYIQGNTVTNEDEAQGGGIALMAGAKVYIEGNTHILENESKNNGGGIALANIGTSELFIYGGAIYSNTATNNGGAIYNLSKLYLGYSDDSTTSEWTGEISGNTAASGAAIWSGSGANVLFDSGTIKNNTAIYDGTNQSLLITGTGTFEMSGTACIESTDPVYFCCYGEDNTISPITITTPLTTHSASKPIPLTPEYWTRGICLVQSGGSVTDLTSYKDFFSFTQEGWETKVSTDKQKLVLDAPIYVAGSETHPVCKKAGSNETGNGLKTAPFATLDKAISLMDDKNIDYTVVVDGEITGAQIISNILKNDGTGTYNAKSVTIRGATNNETDILNGGFTSTSNGTTLSITSDVPITIKKLKITGGYASSPIGGGGLYANGNITLSEGALISGNNTASCGGGIYNESKTLTIEDGAEISTNHEESSSSNCGGGGIFNYQGTLIISGGVIKLNSADHDGGAIYTEEGTCYIYGNTIIGKEVTSAPTEWYYGSNKAENGGAIYINGGTLYLGYMNDNGVAKKDNTANVKIMSNTVKSSASKGGGIYVAAGSAQIAKTSISYNYSPKQGGGIYTKATVQLLEDAVIKGNNAYSFGGGVYIDKDGQLGMNNNSIIGGSNNGDANTSIYGGGVYVSSDNASNPASVAFGTENSTQSIMGNSATSAGGGVYINGIGATFTMNSGTISNNKLVGGTTGGGGIGVYSGTLNLEGGTISENFIQDPSSNGIKGGAVDINTNGKFNIKGTVSIPYGGESGKNDVRMNTSTPISITGAITLPTGASSAATVIPYSYSESIVTLATNPSPETTLAKEVGKFSIVPQASETSLGTGLERGLDGEGIYSDSAIRVHVGENAINDVRSSITTLINNSTENISFCFTDDFRPTLNNSEYMFTIPANKNVTIKAASSVTLTFGSDSNRYNYMFDLIDGSILTIGDNIILDGGYDNSYKVRKCANLSSNSELILDGAKLTKFHYDGGGEMITVNTNSILRIKGNTEIYQNLSPIILKGGTVYMEGGEICNNDLKNIMRAVIILQSEGKFIKSGGRIYNNKGYRGGRSSQNSQVQFYKFYGGGFWGPSVDNLTEYCTANTDHTDDLFFNTESDVENQRTSYY